MRKGAILYNPLSGRRQKRRLEEVRKAAAVLRSAGMEITVAPTLPASGTSEQARHALEQGCEVVFAAGGDGTVHNIVQALVGSDTALGILPLGTANALAHDLRIPLSAVGAARAALTSQVRRIAVGRVSYTGFSGNPAAQYFTVAMGAGVDAHLFHLLNPETKMQLGMLAYYARATWLWCTDGLERFPVSFGGADGETVQAEVSELLAVRIANFGGVLRELAPGAALDRDDLRLVLFRTRSRIQYLRYILRGLVGARWQIPGIELVHSTRVSCQARGPREQPTYVEADGEILGVLPAEVSMVPDALNILAPATPE